MWELPFHSYDADLFEYGVSLMLHIAGVTDGQTENFPVHLI